MTIRVEIVIGKAIADLDIECDDASEIDWNEAITPILLEIGAATCH